MRPGHRPAADPDAGSDVAWAGASSGAIRSHSPSGTSSSITRTRLLGTGANPGCHAGVIQKRSLSGDPDDPRPFFRDRCGGMLAWKARPAQVPPPGGAGP
ncbi:hypothetical protein GCM10027451_15800 [Geodermatophilus aquaeductus]